MTRTWFVFAVAAVVVVPSAAAQQTANPQCGQAVSVLVGGVIRGQVQGGDGCQKAIDLYQYLNTQIGTLVAGGNASLGQGGTLGGLGHFSIGARVNLLNASIPDVQGVNVSTGAPQASGYTTNGKTLVFPEVDAAVGVFHGFPIGITYIGGIDLLGSASYLPSLQQTGVRIGNATGAIRFGYGVRLGLLQETFLTPGISVTYQERSLPVTTIVATASPTESFSVRDLDLRTKAWRVVASKNLLWVTLAAGFGRDYYDASAKITSNVDGQTQTPVSLAVSPKRTSIFGDVSLNLIPFVKLVGELGRVSGGSVHTFNMFDNDVNRSRWYGSIGARLAF
ncbi:MAG TPA: hypothetical protein VL157_11440 [Gemmatimonadaceae bacterium]|nr:hypothetical protein [Gemmatimonadaceae bacterium]